MQTAKRIAKLCGPHPLLFVSTPEPKRNWLALLLRVGLLVALIGAGWRIYHRLPVEESDTDGGQAHATTLHVVLRRPAEVGAANADIGVQLYSVDTAAVWREFQSERRPGVRFNDFLNSRMQGRPPLAARLDATGQAYLAVPPGRWWIHATLDGTEEITWRLPVNVAGREQTVELTSDNAYMRAKSF